MNLDCLGEKLLEGVKSDGKPDEEPEKIIIEKDNGDSHIEEMRKAVKSSDFIRLLHALKAEVESKKSDGL